jgi:ADP-ribose pyrophosphatase
MKTSLTAPKAGEREILFPPSYGKTIVRQPFSYPDGRVIDFVLWGYEKAHSAIVMPITAKGEVIVVRQFRHAANDFVIEFPGGGPVTNNEAAADIAAVELLEETGYRAKEVIDLNIQPWFEPGNLNARISMLVGLGCVRVADPKLDPTEMLEIFTTPIKEWYEMIKRGEVLDNKTLALSLLALPHLGTELRSALF